MINEYYKFGRSHKLLSDNGTKFFENLFPQVASNLGIRQAFSFPIILQTMDTLKMYIPSHKAHVW